jgi:hypothetical protein
VDAVDWHRPQLLQTLYQQALAEKGLTMAMGHLLRTGPVDRQPEQVPPAAGDMLWENWERPQ